MQKRPRAGFGKQEGRQIAGLLRIIFAMR